MPPLTLVTHQNEVDIEGQAHLNENRQHFNDQLRKVINILCNGIILTQQKAAEQYGIYSLSTRISEAKRAGITITKGWTEIEGQRVKVRHYYLLPTEINRLKTLKIV